LWFIFLIRKEEWLENDSLYSGFKGNAGVQTATGGKQRGLAAFCAFRDFGSDRNVHKAIGVAEKDPGKQDRHYRVRRA
jgi:hypothetical protein